MASVVVVGGGIAGLCCAWRLRRAGWDVEVLESEPSAGGRMRSETVGGFRLDRGAGALHGDPSSLASLAAKVGLGDAIGPARGATIPAILHAGRFEPVDLAVPRSMLSGRLLSARGKVGLLRLGLEVARLGKEIDPLVPESSLAFDARDLLTTSKRVAGHEITERLVVPLLSALHGSDIAEHQSGAFLMTTLRLLHDHPDPTYFEGGLGRLTSEVASRLSVRAGCEVFQVESHTEGVRIRYRVGGRSGAVVADAAVVAVPGNRVTALCPKLTPSERGFFEGVEYDRGIVCHFLLDEAPRLPYRRVALPYRGGYALHGFEVPQLEPGAAPDGAGVIRATLGESAVARSWDADDGDVGRLVIGELSRTPLGAISAQRVVVHRWPERLPRFRPGYLHRLREFTLRSERSPRLSFCGDYLIGPWGEAAAASGLHAASELIRELEDS